ncbi:acyl-CoA dehydrogenase [Desulfobacterales bacterium HSG16]|nr:acyl-CoA dehydrogenase [Desulfobacterales bacterium HSG16]
MAIKFFSRQNLNFLLYEVFDTLEVTKHDKYDSHDRKSFDLILNATSDLASNLFRPCLEEMDQNQPRLDKDRVRVHASVKKIMKTCGQGGWIGSTLPFELDGEQLPSAVSAACRFMFAAANYSASVYPELTSGAAGLIASFGENDLIRTYIPNMLAGRWQGTMALTEPSAGSSLSDITTCASPDPGGFYNIEGQKIFISAGDHDGVENVVHLMLAKIEGAPPGVKGISLFVVPKKRLNDAGELVSNDVTVSSVYHKLGYRGAPIVELSIGEKKDCRGWLVGEPGKGLLYMFKMMNESRLGVGLGAAAIASAAYYAALDYSKTRTQGRKLSIKDPASPQVPIIEHADIRRMLLFQRSVVEGSLSLILQCAVYTDMADVAEGEDKERYNLLLDILTPVAKSYPSEMGVISTSQSLQCFGGYGYCRDFPVEQYFRDARIHPIHEGTTGIQGIDLLGRKVIAQQGKAFNLYMETLGETIWQTLKIKEIAPLGTNLEKALVDLGQVTKHKMEIARKEKPEIFLADATLYLEMFGIVTIAWQWLVQAIAAKKELDKNPTKAKKRFYLGKIQTCRYFFAYELPKTKGLIQRLEDTEMITTEMETTWFED